MQLDLTKSEIECLYLFTYGSIYSAIRTNHNAKKTVTIRAFMKLHKACKKEVLTELFTEDERRELKKSMENAVTTYEKHLPEYKEKLEDLKSFIDKMMDSDIDE